MWVEIICGLIVYKLFRCFFFDDDILDVETSDSSALFLVADRIQKLYGGKAYVGLRIPDADTGSRQTRDRVLVTKGELVIISVKNFSGFVSVSNDGNWVCEKAGKHRADRHPDPVAEARKQASILESYLEKRGVVLPEGYISFKVILPNPKLCIIPGSFFPSEVITYEQWVQLKPGPKSMLSSWVKSAFRSGKKEMQESVQQNLDFILSTAPIWDRKNEVTIENSKMKVIGLVTFGMHQLGLSRGIPRLELKGSKYILGEFLEFKGKQEDVQALRNIKRSKVDRIIIQKTSMFGLAHSRLQVLYALRDYRTEGASPEWKEVTVRSSTEIIFQPDNSSKVRKFKLSSVTSMTLSA